MINMDERDVFPEIPEAPAPDVPIQEFMASRLFWLFMKIYILKAIMRFLFWILENHNQSSQAQEWSPWSKYNLSIWHSSQVLGTILS